MFGDIGHLAKVAVYCRRTGAFVLKRDQCIITADLGRCGEILGVVKSKNVKVRSLSFISEPFKVSQQPN